MINACFMIPSVLIYAILDPYYHFFATDKIIPAVQEKLGTRGMLLVMLVIAPWGETFLGQGLPWLLTRLLRLPTTVFLTAATIWFAWLHGWGFNGPDFWAMILGHLAPAFLLAFTFLHGKKFSDWRAIWMTASVHTVANLVVVVGDGIVALARRAMT